MDKPESICTCKQCKKNFPAPSKRFKVCSPECQAILDAAYVRPPRPVITLTCQYCAKTVTRTAVRYDHGKYCSRPCSYAARTAVSVEAKRVKQEQDAVALREWTQAWHAREAAKTAERESRKAAAKALRALDPKYCVVCCGLRLPAEEAIYGSGLCSSSCAEDYRLRKRASEKRAPSRRAQKALEKAKRRRQELMSAELIDPIAVFDRDEWRCYICGVHTPRVFRGTSKPTAPELEHVVSLNDGGMHTWSNVACACRRCNGSKGSRSHYGYEVNLHGPQAVMHLARIPRVFAEGERAPTWDILQQETEA